MRRIQSTITALILSASLASCSSSHDSGDSSSTAAENKATTNESSASPTSSAPPSSHSANAEPQTLAAATSAEKETANRFMSGDYAGAWDLYSSRFQKGISRTDYVKVGQTCSGANGPGVQVEVTGVRLESPTSAVVRMDAQGATQSYTMTYERGQWRQEPTPDFARLLGKPVAVILSSLKAEGSC